MKTDSNEKILSQKLIKKIFFVVILKSTDKNSKIRILTPVYGSKVPDPSKNVYGSGTLNDSLGYFFRQISVEMAEVPVAPVVEEEFSVEKVLHQKTRIADLCYYIWIRIQNFQNVLDPGV